VSRTRRLAVALLVSLAIHVLVLLYVGRHWTTLPELTRPQQRYIEVTLLPPHRPTPMPPPRAKATPLPPSPRPRIARSVTPRTVQRVAATRAPLRNPRPTPRPIPSVRVATAVPIPRHIDRVPPKIVAVPTSKPADVPAVPAATADPDVDTASPSGGSPTGTGAETASGGGGSGSGSGAAAYWPFGLSPGDGGGDGPRHIVYVIDVSASMTSRIDRAREELRRAVETLQPGETFDVISFCRDANKASDTMLPATPGNLTAAKQYVDGLSLGPGTNLEAAMHEALGLPGVNVVVLITDGVPTVGETNPGKLARKIEGWNASGARIYSVGLVGRNPDGTDDTFEATKLLRAISHDSGGTSEIYPLGVATPD
jgi:hypothetical protein